MRLLLLIALLSACGGTPNRTDPVTGKTYSSPLGNDYASQDEYVRRNYLTQTAIANDGGLLPEPEIVAACGAIFEDVARAVPAEHRRDFDFHFFLTCAPAPNAYTYGGGRVHVWLGLVADCRDASEFAGVLAHEIGHISHDHIGQQLGRASRFRKITSLGGILRGPGRTLTESIGGLLGGPVILSHSRAQERQADDRGVDYTRAAGYDPDGLARWFERLSRNEKGGLVFLRSHPSSRDRVARIRRRIAETGGPVTASPRTQAAYARAHARAKSILPYYVELHAALGGDDMERLVSAADAGIRDLPRHAQFHFWKGVALEVKEEASLPSLVRAEELDPANVLYAYIVALVAFSEKAWAEAERGAGHVIALIPAIPAAWLIRGIARYHLGQRDEAYRDLDRIVAAVENRDRDEMIAEIRKHAPDYPGPDR